MLLVLWERQVQRVHKVHRENKVRVGLSVPLVPLEIVARAVLRVHKVHRVCAVLPVRKVIPVRKVRKVCGVRAVLLVLLALQVQQVHKGRRVLPVQKAILAIVDCEDCGGYKVRVALPVQKAIVGRKVHRVYAVLPDPLVTQGIVGRVVMWVLLGELAKQVTPPPNQAPQVLPAKRARLAPPLPLKQEAESI